MPIMDISDPRVIIFLRENYEKESRLRLNWITKNKDKIQEAATLQRKPTNYFDTDVIAHNMEGGLATITRDHIVAGRNRRRVPLRDGTFIPTTKHLRHGHSLIDVGLGDPKEDPKLERPDKDLSNDPIMRPVDPCETKTIYKPEGRVKYLKTRGKILPEKRYYFNECSNWVYGWRLKDSVLKEKPKFGRCWHLTRTLNSRVGPQPDPPHYKSSGPTEGRNCSGL